MHMYTSTTYHHQADLLHVLVSMIVEPNLMSSSDSPTSAEQRSKEEIAKESRHAPQVVLEPQRGVVRTCFGSTPTLSNYICGADSP